MDAIEAMSAAFNDATIAVRNAGGWHATPDLKARVAEAMAQTEAARLRCAYYGDAARRRLEGLAGLGANVTPAIAYGRQGKI
ncbi:hypothetical protein [Sphingomonas sp. DBB INV C78]|uniref:hypothetical protein n=1 Tax=Sphingomonas sp. DBB INV C78 TaxID=3349434 RepID=UPI0036D41664